MNARTIRLETRRGSAGWTALASTVAIALMLCPALTPTEASAANYPKVGAESNRVIELVSNPNSLASVVGGVLSADGDRALYRVVGGGPETSFGNTGTTLAQRTASGWQTSNALPLRSAFGDSGEAGVFAASSDLNTVSVLASPPMGARGSDSLMRYTHDAGKLVRGYTFTPAGAPRALASEDQTHLVGGPGRPLVAEDTAPKGGLYDFGSGQPELIGLLPGDVVPSCGVGNDEFIKTTNGALWQHWISVDGARVFFHSRGNGDCGADPYDLYMREGGANGFTRLISGPATAGPGLGARFSSATPDGSKVFYTTATRLDSRDGNDGKDVYRYTVGVGNRCITCAVPNAQVISDDPGSNDPEKILAAETGERVYFTSSKALAPGATEGDTNIYVWSEETPDEIRFVAPTNFLNTTTGNTNAAATPDGAVFVFSAADPDLDALTNSDSRGLGQFYRYDDRARTLVCASCPEGRATVASGGGFGASGLITFLAPSPLTRDGRSFFFQTTEALVARDVNAGYDIYEWRDGRVGLITDGTSYRASHTMIGLSEDGRDLLFISSSDLAVGVRADGVKLYDARVGGGFPERPPALSECEGDGCQAASIAVPDVSSPMAGGGGDGGGGVSRVSFREGRLSASQRLALAAGRRAIVAVRVSRPGVVRAGLGRYGTDVSKRAGRAGVVRLSVRLSQAARRKLAREEKLEVTLTVRFAGSAEIRMQKLDLRRPR